jgi:hypothetical protein
MSPAWVGGNDPLELDGRSAERYRQGEMPIGCSQCGRAAPSDPVELETWKHGSLVLAGDADEVTTTMLLCPECAEDDRAGDYETGEPG